MDALERCLYGLDERDAADEALDVANVGDDGPTDEASASPCDRQWSDEEKALVVRECCWPGTRVGEVARRYGLSANQVNGLEGACAAALRGRRLSSGIGGRSARIS